MRLLSLSHRPSPRGTRNAFTSAGLTTLLQGNTSLGCYTPGQEQGWSEHQLCPLMLLPMGWWSQKSLSNVWGHQGSLRQGSISVEGGGVLRTSSSPLGGFHHLHVKQKLQSQSGWEALTLWNNNNELILRAGTPLNALQMSTNLFLLIPVQGTYYDDPYFTDGDTEAEDEQCA